MVRLRIIIMVIVCVLLVGSPLAYANGPTFKINDIVEAIKLEIMGAQALEDEVPKMTINNFSLTLTVVAIRKSNGSIEFEVPGVDAEAEKGFSTSATHTITITMSLSEETKVTPIASSLGILPAIQQIKSTLRSACSVPPHFTTNLLSFTIEFAVVRTDKNDYRFEIIEAEKPEYKNFITHTLTVQMSPSN